MKSSYSAKNVDPWLKDMYTDAVISSALANCPFSAFGQNLQATGLPYTREIYIQQIPGLLTADVEDLACYADVVTQSACDDIIAEVGAGCFLRFPRHGGSFTSKDVLTIGNCAFASMYTHNVDVAKTLKERLERWRKEMRELRDTVDYLTSPLVVDTPPTTMPVTILEEVQRNAPPDVLELEERVKTRKRKKPHSPSLPSLEETKEEEEEETKEEEEKEEPTVEDGGYYDYCVVM